MVLHNYKMKLHDVDYCKAHFDYVTMKHYILNYMKGAVAVQYLYAKCLFYDKIKIKTKEKIIIKSMNVNDSKQ